MESYNLITLGDLVNQLREAGSVGSVDTSRRIRIKSSARRLRIQIEKLLDAVGIGEG